MPIRLKYRSIVIFSESFFKSLMVFYARPPCFYTFIPLTFFFKGKNRRWIWLRLWRPLVLESLPATPQRTGVVWSMRFSSGHYRGIFSPGRYADGNFKIAFYPVAIHTRTPRIQLCLSRRARKLADYRGGRRRKLESTRKLRAKSYIAYIGHPPAIKTNNSAVIRRQSSARRQSAQVIVVRPRFPRFHIVPFYA